MSPEVVTPVDLPVMGYFWERRERKCRQNPSFQDSVMRLLREVSPDRSEEVALPGAPALTTWVFHHWIWWAVLLFHSWIISSSVERDLSFRKN